MSKKKGKRINPQKVQKILDEKEPEKRNNLVFGGVLLAISSLGLLLFVLSEKVFHLG